MTGAGSAEVAYAVEDTYGTLPAEPTWIQPGTDITVGDLSIQQALQRTRNPDDPRPLRSWEGEFEGAASVSFTLTDDNFHDLVFADAGTALPSGPATAPSATWYFVKEMPDGTLEERFASGAVVVDASINYQQGAEVTVDLTMIYGDEPTDITTPGTIQQPTGDQVYTWHGTSLDVNNLGQSLLQQATISLSNLARFRRGQDRHPFDAVVGAIEPSFSSDATYTERDQLEVAYGGGTSPQDVVGEVSGSITFENGLAETIGYNMSGMQPTSYAWSELVNPDGDMSEPIDYHVTHVEAV